MRHRLVYLSRADVESAALPLAEIIARVELALGERGRGRSEMPPKPGIHPGGEGADNFLHAMPAYLPGLRAAGIKWVGGYPGNPSRGLPYITGLMILNDAATGLPVAVMDCSWITAMRTAAATAVASRYLGPENPQRLAILGCGVQGRANLESLKTVHPGLREVRAYDILPEATRAYVETMEREHPDLRVAGVPGPREALLGADLVVTAGPIRKKPQPVIEPDWFAEGALGVALDYDSYWRPETMRAADLFVTDDTNQLLSTRTEGYFMQIPEIHADLCQIVAGARKGRTSPAQRILCMNLGLAIYDVAVAARILEVAREKGLGTHLPI